MSLRNIVKNSSLTKLNEALYKLTFTKVADADLERQLAAQLEKALNADMDNIQTKFDEARYNALKGKADQLMESLKNKGVNVETPKEAPTGAFKSKLLKGLGIAGLGAGAGLLAYRYKQNTDAQNNSYNNILRNRTAPITNYYNMNQSAPQYSESQQVQPPINSYNYFKALRAYRGLN